MEHISLKQKVEAVLYLKAQPITIPTLAHILGCPEEDAETGLLDLVAEYAHRDSALEISETADGFALGLRSEFTDLVHELVPLALSKGTLRTLAAIAIKPNVSQAEIVELRGSTAYQHIQELVHQGFVQKRRQSDGRSHWLNVTNKFHQYFEIDDLSVLLNNIQPEPAQLEQLES